MLCVSSLSHSFDLIILRRSVKLYEDFVSKNGFGLLWYIFFITVAFLFKIFKNIFNRLAPCAPLGGSQYRPSFGLQYLGNGKCKHYLLQTFFKEYSTSFLMVCRLIDFALVVLKLLMFKFCVTIGISKIEFFNFSGTERV